MHCCFHIFTFFSPFYAQIFNYKQFSLTMSVHLRGFENVIHSGVKSELQLNGAEKLAFFIHYNLRTKKKSFFFVILQDNDARYF